MSPASRIGGGAGRGLWGWGCEPCLQCVCVEGGGGCKYLPGYLLLFSVQVLELCITIFFAVLELHITHFFCCFLCCHHFCAPPRPGPMHHAAHPHCPPGFLRCWQGGRGGGAQWQCPPSCYNRPTFY